MQRIDQALAHGAAFLRTQQSEDGAFRTPTYASFRDGSATTPLALMALWVVPGERPSLGGQHPPRPRLSESRRLAPLRFARRSQSAFARGVSFVANGDPEHSAYPEYALATSLLVLGMPTNRRHRLQSAAFEAALRARQREDGGWGYLSEPSNLSSTLFAIGALRLAGARENDPAMQRARSFAEQCQNFGGDPRFDDGGFFFSPGLADGNKAGPAGTDASGRTRFHSYGSMTADGLRALLRLGARPEDPRVLAASRWLRTHFSARTNPGRFVSTYAIRGESAYFYYAWSVAHALRAMGEARWAAPLARELLTRQRKDGSWRNRYTEMHEDDPIVATSFAMASLANARIALTGEHRSHATFR